MEGISRNGRKDTGVHEKVKISAALLAVSDELNS
ncbi:MAG: hypothetical protein C5S49_03935 [Candidatus Methanogaster sp.]|nr:MAG: hypothetical protein C5S49_03935 [ANME-2 cluster archaeon]